MDGTDGGNTFHELYLQATAQLNRKGVGEKFKACVTLPLCQYLL